MANDLKNVAIGGAVVSIADWAANGGATGHVDLGILKDPPELTPAQENYEPEFESLPGAPVAYPTKDGFEIKLALAEVTPDNIGMFLRQPTGNVTGSAPNKTGLVGDSTEQYKSVKIVTKGGTGALGTRATRTLTLHRCVVRKTESITFGKGKEQLLIVTLGVLYDTTVTTNDKFFKIVDSGGA